MAKETTLNEIGETLAYVVAHMATKEETATKDDIAALRSELKADVGDVRAEVSAIRRDLDHLSESVVNVIGYRKEIDHALERIAAIEKKIAA